MGWETRSSVCFRREALDSMCSSRIKRLEPELVYTATAAAALLYIYTYIHNSRFEEADCGCVNGSRGE